MSSCDFKRKRLHAKRLEVRATTQEKKPAEAGHGQIALSPQDSSAFAATLIKASPVNGRLRETVRTYRRTTPGQ